MITLLVHIANQEPIKVDVEEIPNLTQVAFVGNNPRDRKDRELNFVDEGVTTIVIPWWRVNYIQVMPDTEAAEEFPLPFRND